MSEIIVTRHKNQTRPSNYYDTYEWVGSKWETASIGLYKRDFDTLPWPVKIIETTDFDRGAIVVRKDVGFGLWWRLVKTKRSIGQRFLWVKSRIILTANIWGIGYWPEGTYVSWKYLRRKR